MYCPVSFATRRHLAQAANVLRTALKAAWHVVVHLFVVVMDVTQVLAVAWFVTLVLAVHGNAASAAAGCKQAGQRPEIANKASGGRWPVSHTGCRIATCWSFVQ